MTIKSSGSLTFTEIEAEWDNASPFSLSEFYSGTSTVFSGAADGDGNVIPSSGAISFSDFYNTTFFNASALIPYVKEPQGIPFPSIKSVFVLSY